MKKKEFYKRLIYEVFIDYFVKYSFEEIADNIDALAFRNENCLFKFTVDHSDFDLNITSLKDVTFNYNIKIIHLVLLNKSFNLNPQFTNGEAERLKLQLIEFLVFLESKLKGVTEGDFSWSKSYLDYDEKEKEIHKILWSLDIKDPIYLKFKSRDLTWKDDILKLMKINK